ncbi:hypothetical protein, partial [Frankia tisae]|uniref:hypothetical protein n=1 Tax=Frankia tisae TaxID=2950104 RepID=UPI0021C036F1
ALVPPRGGGIGGGATQRRPPMVLPLPGWTGGARTAVGVTVAFPRGGGDTLRKIHRARDE